MEGGSAPSHPLHKTIHHAFFPRLVEADGQLVAVDGGDVAVAEFEGAKPVALLCRLRLGAEAHGREDRGQRHYRSNARDVTSSNE